jgi:hypothetical protein
MMAEEANRRARERSRRVEQIVRAMVYAAEAPENDRVAVAIRHDLAQRLHATARRLGWQRGSRRLASALLALGLDEVEQLQLTGDTINAIATRLEGP